MTFFVQDSIVSKAVTQSFGEYAGRSKCFSQANSSLVNAMARALGAATQHTDGKEENKDWCAKMEGRATR